MFGEYPSSDSVVKADHMFPYNTYTYTSAPLLFHINNRSSGGRVVKLLACGVRGPGFDSRPRHLNFQGLVISCFQVEIWLKDRLIDVNPKLEPQGALIAHLSTMSTSVIS